MRLREHLYKISSGDIRPRVVEHSGFSLYVAWTPTWEGPPRPDYAAAHADLMDRLRGVTL
jgi:hypothetical protein